MGFQASLHVINYFARNEVTWLISETNQISSVRFYSLHLTQDLK